MTEDKPFKLNEDISFKQQIRNEIEEFCKESGTCKYDPDEVVLESFTRELQEEETEIVKVSLREEPNDEYAFEVNKRWGIIDFVPSLINDIIHISDHY